MSRSTWDTPRVRSDFAYGPFTLFGGAFQRLLLSYRIPQWGPATPSFNEEWFGLFPFRSPLLRESLLFYFPPGTEMFHFPGSGLTVL